MIDVTTKIWQKVSHEFFGINLSSILCTRIRKKKDENPPLLPRKFIPAVRLIPTFVPCLPWDYHLNIFTPTLERFWKGSFPSEIAPEPSDMWQEKSFRTFSKRSTSIDQSTDRLSLLIITYYVLGGRNLGSPPSIRPQKKSEIPKSQAE